MSVTNFERLECLGLWRASPNEQRVEVIVTFGKSTLVFLDNNEQPLAHWSLGAIVRVNPLQTPAIFAVGAGAEETIQIEDTEIIAHIAALQSKIRRRPKPGRVRFWIALLVLLAGGVGLRIWLPDAIASYATRIIPEVKIAEIGRGALAQVYEITGAPCEGSGDAALAKLTRSLAPRTQVYIVDMEAQSAVLPARIILINEGMLDAGLDDFSRAIVLESARVQERVAVYDAFRFMGAVETLRFLTTGKIKQEALDGFAMQRLDASRDIASSAGSEPPPTPSVLDETEWEELRSICSNF